MLKKSLSELLKSSILNFFKSPFLALPSLSLLLFVMLFSKISVAVNYKLETTFMITAWLILFIIVVLGVGSYLFSALIVLSEQAVKNRKDFKLALYTARKYWLRNFGIMIFVLVSYNIIRIIAHYGAGLVGQSLSLSVQNAAILFYIIYFAGLIGGIIFITFSSFFIVLHDQSLIASIKSSYIFVKKNYLLSLGVLVFFFLINFLLSYINNPLFEDLINALIILPYFTVALTNIVLNNYSAKG